jgi:hypothetical protein
LHSRRFSEPVTVHRTHADGTVHPTPIITTKEAYDALMEAGHALANPAWQAALDAIVRALLDPTPENVEAGRIAFDRLHHPHPSGSSQRAARNPGSSLVDTRHDGSSRMPLTAAIIRSCAVKAHLTMAGSRTDLLHRPAAKPAKHPSLKLRQSARPGRNVTGFTSSTPPGGNGSSCSRRPGGALSLGPLALPAHLKQTTMPS